MSALRTGPAGKGPISYPRPKEIEYWVSLHDGRLKVPRVEFFAALKHYATAKHVEAYQRMELKAQAVEVILVGIEWRAYAETMHAAGRYAQGSSVEERASAQALQADPQAFTIKSLRPFIPGKGPSSKGKGPTGTES